MVLDDGVDAVRACGVLLARRDDEAARFEQERGRGHSRGQVVVVHHRVCPERQCRDDRVIRRTVLMWLDDNDFPRLSFLLSVTGETV